MKNLVQVYPGTDWPTIYLTDAKAAGDKEAAREALWIIQGNYSPEVIIDPDAFQSLSEWAEEKP